jgi:lipoprotein-anchoring transpeptidase ErfK/SrfK
VLLLLGGCAVVAVAAVSAVASPALALILSGAGWQSIGQEPPPPPQFWAKAEIPKPTYAAPLLATRSLAPVASPETTRAAPGELLVQVDTPFPSATNTLVPEVVVIPDTATPEFIPFLDYTVTPDANATPGVLFAEIVPDTPTSEYVAPTAAVFDPAPVANVGSGEHWIDVDLSQQRVYAFAGDTVVNSFLVSTGTWQTPTVTGQYHVWIKLKSTTMAGPGYYLTNVPWVMYFYKGYGLHGTYWHNNFGTPMSHGCVNLTIPDAEWLYNFASVGTLVNVHY